MNDQLIMDIDTAMLEARRFIQRASAWKKVLKRQSAIYPSKEGGSAKRASMDLTRALVYIRNPRR
jgi:hypothetical protein